MAADVRVATYNIHRGVGIDGRLDLERVADVLARTDADLVGLQEVDRRYRASTGFADQLSILGDRLGVETAFGPALERPPEEGNDEQRGQYGVAALSRHPIRDSEVVPLAHEPAGERRVLLQSTVDVTGGPAIEFCTTHLGLSSAIRRQQAADVLEATDATAPSVIVGDFNATPGSPPIEALTERFDDAFEEAGAGNVPTFPSPYVEPGDDPSSYAVSVPDRRIDYVFPAPGVHVTGVDVVESLASDHSLVVADLRVPE